MPAVNWVEKCECGVDLDDQGTYHLFSYKKWWSLFGPMVNSVVSEWSDCLSALPHP